MAKIPNCSTCNKPLETERVTETRISRDYNYQVLTNYISTNGRLHHKSCVSGAPRTGCEFTTTWGVCGGPRWADTPYCIQHDDDMRRSERHTAEAASASA